MRPIIALFILGCLVSLSPGQYVENTIPLPDSTSGLTSVGSLVYHSPTNTIYVGGDDSFLIAVNAQTNSKLKRVAVGGGPHLLCSDPPGNKVYCANYDATVTVIDGATNQPVKTFSAGRAPTDFCYNERERKLYCGNVNDSFVRVIDCVGDSVVAQVPVSYVPGALCYNPQLNRIYCAHETGDEVTVIDCAADTVIGTVWVRGVEPADICYDSATNCVYTANSYSGTVSAIDCAGDTIVRLVPVGRWPEVVEAGPAGKVYCANHSDSSVSVISDSGVKTVRVGRYQKALSFDPVNSKVYCTYDYADSITVIDAARDTVLANVKAGSNSDEIVLCHNPAGNNTYAACMGYDVVLAVGGVSDTIEALITVGACSPGPLCYNTTNNHLYCLDQTRGMLFVIDGDSNRVLKTLKAPTSSGSDTLIWNPVSNKVYFTNWENNRVFILDCASDSIIAAVETGSRPRALCCSDDGKVHVANYGGDVAVIDGSGDSIRAVVPVGDNPTVLCYDRTDNKVYVGKSAHAAPVSVIDVDGDSVAASIPVPNSGYATICWNQNHDKVYVSNPNYDSPAVIDCAGDTVLRIIRVTTGLEQMYSDSVCDKVYCVDDWDGCLRIIRAATDTYYKDLSVGYVTALLDNGKQGPANQLYCANESDGRVTVVRGYKTDSIVRRISVGAGPVALAWSPAHSRVYVSNYGSSSISVIRDTFGLGVEEGQLQASSHKPQATVVRGILFLDSRLGSSPSTSYLLDISGRKVLDIHPGANDVRALAPGVYFVREAQAQAQAVQKIVLAR